MQGISSRLFKTSMNDPHLEGSAKSNLLHREETKCSTNKDNASSKMKYTPKVSFVDSTECVKV